MKHWFHAIFAGLLVTRAFALENAAVKPLPGLDTIIPGIIAQVNRENDNEKIFKRSYSYTRTRVTEYRTSAGDLKSREEKTSQKNPRTNLLARAKSSVSKSASANDVALDKKDLTLSPAIVDRFDLALTGREIINGRPALVISFKPKSTSLPESNLKDRFINRAAGTLWIDEADLAIAKADVHLVGQVNVFGGVAGAVWKFNAKLDRARTADGLWYISNMNWHVEGREIVIPRFMDYHEQWTNIQKTR